MSLGRFAKKIVPFRRVLTLRNDVRTKKRFNSNIARIGGGGLPLPEFFCALFLLKEKVSSMVATAEKVGEVARLGGWGGGLANSGNARIETFFLYCTRPLTDVIPTHGIYKNILFVCLFV